MLDFACSKNLGSEALHYNILGQYQLLLMRPRDSFEHRSTSWRALSATSTLAAQTKAAGLAVPITVSPVSGLD